MLVISLDLELGFAALHSKSRRIKTMDFELARENFFNLIEPAKRYRIKLTVAAVFGLIEKADSLLEYLRSPCIETACHGYSHRSFDVLSEKEAFWELKKCREIAKRKNIKLNSFVFPRNEVRHLHLLKKFGYSHFIFDSNRNSALDVSLPFEIAGLKAMPRTLYLDSFSIKTHAKILWQLNKKFAHFWLHAWNINDYGIRPLKNLFRMIKFLEKETKFIKEI
ncbi:MAG: polysaccharide deacetylase family protein [Candidatus Diapherotrites archaeon]|nr:polysaccharide deacetylase family protein [Candidatus Diapherotrites archaeon]